MRFIHVADIHLDSSLTTNLSGDKRTTRKNELLQTFKRLVEFAIYKQVTGIIIAGDFFDAKKVSAKTKKIVFDLISKNSEIDFLYLCGNHDEALSVLGDQELPANLKVFNQNITTYEYDNVTVSGVELTKSNFNFVYDDIKLNPLKTNIFVLHGEVSENGNKNNYESIPLKKLANKNIKYLALGHYHTYQSAELDAKGVYAYSGCLEGRGFDETGTKGFVLIDITDGKLSHEFVPFASRELYEFDVDVTNKTSHLQLEKTIRESLAQTDAKSLLRINLVGEVLLSERVDVQYFTSLFEDKFFYITFKDKTKLKINLQDYENDISLKGEFIRQVQNSKLSDEQKQKVILTGVAALLGEEV